MDILAAETGWVLGNWGANGRELPDAAPDIPADTDLLIVMLGTNDLFQGRRPKATAERMERFLTGLMEHLDNAAKPVITQGEDGSFHVELVGSNLGALIGRRGETLDAIQQLTNYSVNRGQNKRVRIHLDAENYRAKREETLERLARKTAGKALKYHRNMTLEPMNAYERHVIHAALQDYEGVTTYSTGSEPNRRVVVACER